MSSMDSNLVSSKDKTLEQAIQLRRNKKSLNNLVSDIVYSYGEDKKCCEQEIRQEIENFAKKNKIGYSFGLLRPLNKDTFILEAYDRVSSAGSWHTVQFLHKQVQNDYFEKYSCSNALGIPIALTAICLLPKERSDIDLSWRAIRHLKNNMGLIYVTDESVQYDFINSDAFTRPCNPIEKTKIEIKYVLFGPDTFDTLSMMVAAGAFCLIPAAPFIFIWMARWCTKGL